MDSLSFGIFSPLLFETSLFPRGAHTVDFFPLRALHAFSFLSSSFPLSGGGKRSRAGAIYLATTTVSGVNSRSGGPS